jgi:hypothetical protein
MVFKKEMGPHAMGYLQVVSQHCVIRQVFIVNAIPWHMQRTSNDSTQANRFGVIIIGTLFSFDSAGQFA